MLVIIRAVPGRAALHPYLAERLPDAVWSVDRAGSARANFLSALAIQAGEGALHLDDDVILTRDFPARAAAAVAGWEEVVVQCFSMRGADRTVGSRWASGSTFVNTQCFWMPGHLAPDVIAHYEAGWTSKPGLFDLGVGDFLRSRRLRYRIHVPSLVQHRDGPSMLGHVSSRWHSPTFVDPWL